MSIPDFQTIMLPLLKITADGNEHSIHNLVNKLGEVFSITEQEIREMLPSGKQPLFYNRVSWARTYLSKSGLIELTHRSFYRITERGKQVIQENPPRIDMKYLQKFPEYLHFKDRVSSRKTKKIPEERDEKTPEERLDDAYQEIRDNLAADVLENVMACPPDFFERLVVELLVAMGYGGSEKEAARAVGRSGDGGVDGIIDEDRLGLDIIYIQAKRWKEAVGRPEIQKFVGALAGKKSKKGIFITTSSFTNDADKYSSEVDLKIILIDGKKLADLMIDYNIGVTELSVFRLKRIDSDYFTS